LVDDFAFHFCTAGLNANFGYFGRSLPQIAEIKYKTSIAFEYPIKL